MSAPHETLSAMTTPTEQEWLTLLRTMTAHLVNKGRTACGKTAWGVDPWEPCTASDKRCYKCERKAKGKT